MGDDQSVLTKQAVREEAREILLALDGSRVDPEKFEDSWRRLWQLAREARAAGLAVQDHNKPWSMDFREDPLPAILVADSFSVPIWPTSEGRLEPDLAGLLNWAGVPVPMPDRRSTDLGEAARESAERRREQAELHRRQSEEGREIAETIRSRHEGFREDQEVSGDCSEQMRDSQEAGRELAEQAREISEQLRRTAEDARVVLDEGRQALSDLKDLAQQQRLVLERQEKSLAAFESRTRESPR